MELKLDEKVGTVSVVTAGSAGAQGGFYCDVCQCIVKDSTNYIDHLNGKKRTLPFARAPLVLSPSRLPSQISGRWACRCGRSGPRSTR